MSRYRRSLSAFIISIILLQLFAFSPASASSEAEEAVQLKWSKLYAEPTDKDFHTGEYVYGNGVYVSRHGYTSKDAIHWTSIPHFEEMNISINDIVYGKGLFVAVGFARPNFDDVAVWTSTDGVNWNDTAKLKAYASEPHIAFSGTRFVAAGGNNGAGYIFSSEDGLKWTERKSGMTTDIKGLEWGNNTFVALGYQGRKFLVSKDGITWKKVDVPITESNSMWDLQFGGGAFVAVGNYTLITSKDGVKWTSVPSSGIFWSKVTWVKGRFFAEGMKYIDERTGKSVTVLKTSKNGKVWQDLVNLGPLPSKNYGGTSIYYFDPLYDGKQFMAYTDIGIYSSADGVKWKLVKKIELKPISLRRLAIGNGKLVVVGGDQDTFNSEYEHNNDRGLWQIDSKGNYQYKLELEKYPLNDLIWTGSQFFAVGVHGLMMTSKDGMKWTQLTSPTQESLYRVIRANGVYYTTGSNGLIMTSEDLKTWKKLKTSTIETIRSIAWSGKKFVAVGDKGVTLTSDNGTAWKQYLIHETNGDANYDLTDVVWGNGSFIITADLRYNLTDYGHTIFKSADGTKWNKVTLPFGDNKRRTLDLYGVYYSGDMFAAVGNYGSVYLSKDGNTWIKQQVPDDNFGLSAAQIFNGKLYVISQTRQIYSTKLDSAILNQIFTVKKPKEETEEVPKEEPKVQPAASIELARAFLEDNGFTIVKQKQDADYEHFEIRRNNELVFDYTHYPKGDEYSNYDSRLTIYALPDQNQIVFSEAQAIIELLIGRSLGNMSDTIVGTETDSTFGYLYVDNTEATFNGTQIMYIFNDGSEGNTEETYIKFDYNPKPGIDKGI